MILYDSFCLSYTGSVSPLLHALFASRRGLFASEELCYILVFLFLCEQTKEKKRREGEGMSSDKRSPQIRHLREATLGVGSSSNSKTVSSCKERRVFFFLFLFFLLLQNLLTSCFRRELWCYIVKSVMKDSEREMVFAKIGRRKRKIDRESRRGEEKRII